MSDELIERLRNPIGFAVLHTEAMQAIERIEKAEAEIERLRAELAYWHRVAETEHIRLTNELKAARGE